MVFRERALVLSGIRRLFPVDQTTGYDYSYRSHANNAVERSPTRLLSIVHSC